MKIKLLNILVFFLLTAVAAEMLSGIWIKKSNTVVLLEKEEMSDAKDGVKEKEESKDKVARPAFDFSATKVSRTLYVLSHTLFKYAAYISIPEQPPKQS